MVGKLKLFIWAILVMAVMSSATCTKSAEPEPGPVPEQDQGDDEKVDNILLMNSGRSTYTVVYSSTLSEKTKLAVKAFAAGINAAAGTSIQAVCESDVKPSPKEIVIGLAETRTASRKAYDLIDADYGFIIKVIGKRLVIEATDEDYLVAALYTFDKDVLWNIRNKPTINLDGDYEYIEKHAMPVSIGLAVEKNMTGRISWTLVGTASRSTVDSNVRIGQGMCLDGKGYAYFALSNGQPASVRDPEVCRACIVKYRLDPWEFVKEGPIYNSFGHCNDMDYDPVTGKCVLLDGWSDPTATLSYIDTETLELTGTKTMADFDANRLNKGSWGFAINPMNNEYGISNGSLVVFTNPGIEYVGTYGGTNVPSGYTSQGTGSDGEYVYFPLSPSSGTVNKFAVSKWKGKVLGHMDFDNGVIESEDCYFIGTDCYVNMYQGGGASKLFKSKLEVTYESKI